MGALTDVGSFEPSGPPVRLLTRRERVRRRRAIAFAVVIIGGFAVFLTVLVLRFATRPNADVNLGSETFKVGRAAPLARRIEAENFPLLFQDPRDDAVDLFITHSLSKNHLFGWRAFEAHAPNAPRTCQLEWTGRNFRDPCDEATYPADGTGLRQFTARVVDGVLYVDFR